MKSTTSSEGRYNQDFGADARTVLAQGSAADQDQFTQKLLGEADRGSDPAYVELLLDKAIDIASRRAENTKTAILVLKRLQAAVPDRETECRDRILKLCQDRHRNSAPADRQEFGRIWRNELVEAADAETTRESYAKAVALLQRAADLSRSGQLPDAEAIAAKLADAKPKDRKRSVDDIYKR